MKETKNPIIHFEIPVDDIDRATSFYQDIFEWEITKMDMPVDSSTGGEPYYSVKSVKTDDKGNTLDNGINGGMMKRKISDQPFTNYIHVESIDDMLTKIQEKGGKVCMPKTSIGENMGYIALFIDTENNMMGLHQM